MTDEKPGFMSGDLSSIEPDAAPIDGDRSGEVESRELPTDLPPVPLLASGSHDDTFITPPYPPSLGPAEPDPILGEFVTPIAEGSASFPVATGPDHPDLILSSASGTNFPTINFDAPQSPLASKSARPEDDGSVHDEEDEFREHRTPWSTVLLASYASAITLALGWIVLKDRPREKAETVATPAAVGQPESARQSGLSRKVEPPEPILGEHFATVGHPLQVGSLEVTPLGVRRENVALQRSNDFATPQRRDGGKKALFLRLKLRNTSADAVFAPLDQAYLRERGKGLVDTFVETADGERIYPYPLAVDSELSIVGQDFTELRPGESRIVAIVSAPDAPLDAAGPFTWRVRLRTGINRTDTIGVRWPDKSPEPR